MKKLTIFTATYNRANLLPRLYKSLCNQTCKEFEWVVVDDGSTDDTHKVIEQFIEQQIIDIQYFLQPNGGKCRAINSGVKMAEGYLFMIVDSDDMLYDENVVQKVVSYMSTLELDNHCCGIIGNKTNLDRTIIGNGSKPIDGTSFIELREKYRLWGDKEEVVKTSIMQKYPFPEFEGENFMPEAVVWNRISKKYRVNYTAEPYVSCEYQTDGLTAQVLQCRRKNPQAFMLYYSEYCASQGVRWANKLKRSTAYWATYFKSNNCPKEGRYFMIRNWWCALPFGFLLHKLKKI